MGPGRACVVCGSVQVAALIRGAPYCRFCGTKVLSIHLTKVLTSMQREGLIPSSLKIGIDP